LCSHFLLRNSYHRLAILTTARCQYTSHPPILLSRQLSGCLPTSTRSGWIRRRQKRANHQIAWEPELRQRDFLSNVPKLNSYRFMKNLIFPTFILLAMSTGCNKMNFEDIPQESLENPDPSTRSFGEVYTFQRGSGKNAVSVEISFDEVSDAEKTMRFSVFSRKGTVIYEGTSTVRAASQGEGIIVYPPDLPTGICCDPDCDEYNETLCNIHECVSSTFSEGAAYVVVATAWWCPECTAGYAAGVIIGCTINVLTSA